MLSRHRAAISSNRPMAGVMVPFSIIPGDIIAVAREFADRDAGAVDRQRREDDVDPAAVRQAAIDHRTGFVDAPAHACRNLLRH